MYWELLLGKVRGVTSVQDDDRVLISEEHVFRLSAVDAVGHDLLEANLMVDITVCDRDDNQGVIFNPANNKSHPACEVRASRIIAK